MDIMNDQLKDTSSQQLHVYTHQFMDGELPDYVKAAEVHKDQPAADAPSHVFANIHDKTYPCHSKSATFASCLYFYAQRANGEKWASHMPETKVEARLTKAANFFGVMPDVLRLKKNIEVKTASPDRPLSDSDYALVVQYGDETIRRFPTVSKAATVKSAEALHRDRAHYPYSWRKQAAVHILKAAMEQGASIESDHMNFLVKSTGMYKAASKDIAEELVARSFVYDGEVRNQMHKAADRVAAGNCDLHALCELVDEIDREADHHMKYARGLLTPEEVFFSVPVIKIANADQVTLTTGNRYHLEDIKQAGLEPFTAIGDAYVREVAANDLGDLDLAKVAQILPTLPRDDAQMLEQAFNAVGVPTVTEKAATEVTEKRDMVRQFVTSW
jgi:hypothetical protein